MLQAHALTPLADAPRGKFVLLRGEDGLHFVCAPLRTHPYHANIIFTFLEQGGRGQARMLEPVYCKISGDDWEMLGGGHYDLNREHRLLVLSGKSTTYGKYPVDLLRKASAHLTDDLGFPDFGLKIA
jgi:hypothetical protein